MSFDALQSGKIRTRVKFCRFRWSLRGESLNRKRDITCNSVGIQKRKKRHYAELRGYLEQQFTKAKSRKTKRHNMLTFCSPQSSSYDSKGRRKSKRNVRGIPQVLLIFLLLFLFLFGIHFSLLKMLRTWPLLHVPQALALRRGFGTIKHCFVRSRKIILYTVQVSKVVENALFDFWHILLNALRQPPCPRGWIYTVRTGL